MPHPFLSAEWLAAAREIQARYAERERPVVRLNLTVTGAPFGDGVVATSIDTAAGGTEFALGSLDDADVSVTTDYETARAIFVNNEPGAAVQAMLAGKVVVEGDLMQLIALQAAILADPDAAAIAAEIQSITA